MDIDRYICISNQKTDRSLIEGGWDKHLLEGEDHIVGSVIRDNGIEAKDYRIGDFRIWVRDHKHGRPEITGLGSEITGLRSLRSRDWDRDQGLGSEITGFGPEITRLGPEIIFGH